MPQTRFETSRPQPRLLVLAAAIAFVLTVPGVASASRSQWSMVEDHGYLVCLGGAVRDATLPRRRRSGPTRCGSRSSGARSRRSGRELAAVVRRHRPGRAYPGFEPYDDLVRKATAQGFRSPDHTRPGRSRLGHGGGRGGNYKVDSRDFADFARAVGKRYSGAYAGLPKVTYWSSGTSPTTSSSSSPARRRPRVYRGWRGLSALKAAVPGARVFVGELAPVGTATKVIGPLRFLQQWLCVDKSYKRLRGRTARKQGCNGSSARARERVRPPPVRSGGHRLPRPRHREHGIRRPRARSTSRRGPRITAGSASTTPSSATRPTPTRSSARRRPPGRDPQHAGGVLLPLLAAEELLAVPDLRRPRATARLR